MELAAGTAVDRFVVEGMIGRGGMASVYRIRHRTLNVAYALKVMHVTHPELADRIHSEGALQAELRHPNIVTVFDMIEVGGLPALVMEYVDGPSMAAMLEVHQPTLDQVDELVRGMLKGVRAAHAAGLIHRDIKPANVLLAHADEGYLPKITDFGLAKSLAGSPAAVQTRTGVVMGTPSYMAPEQFRNTRAVDARADIYSLGVVMYELCAGRRPYDEEDLFDLLDRVRNADYPRVTELVPSLPDRMADAIEGAMAVEPDERVATVDQLYDIWSGNARVDRSRVWNRAVLQQIGQSLSENQPEGIEVPGARSSQRKSGASVAEPAPAAPAATPAAALPQTVGPASSGPGPLDAGGPLRLDAPGAPTPVTLGLSPASEASAAEEPADDADEGLAANDDRTRFEPIVRPMTPIVPSDPDASSDDLAETEKVRAVQAADERPATEWVGEEDDVPAPTARPAQQNGPPAPMPAPPIPAALAQASILVPSEIVPSEIVPSERPQAPLPTPAGAPAATAPAAARKVSLTDSTPSLHLPGGTAPASASSSRSDSAPSMPPVATGGLGRTLPVAAALLMVVLLLVGGGMLLVVGGGSVLYALTGTGGDESPLPVIEVPGEGGDPGGVDVAPPEPDVDPPSEDPVAEPGGGETPDGEPGEAPEVAPAPTPTPAPARGRPPAPKVEKGTVELTGDARSIRLVSGGKSFAAGSVPVGTYELKATFPGQGELPQRATVTVRKGARVTVNCVAGFFSCTVK